MNVYLHHFCRLWRELGQLMGKEVGSALWRGFLARLSTGSVTIQWRMLAMDMWMGMISCVIYCEAFSVWTQWFLCWSCSAALTHFLCLSLLTELVQTQCTQSIIQEHPNCTYTYQTSNRKRMLLLQDQVCEMYSVHCTLHSVKHAVCKIMSSIL